jgi:hypothetical protein
VGGVVLQHVGLERWILISGSYIIDDSTLIRTAYLVSMKGSLTATT